MVALSSKGFKQCGAYCWWLLCCANKFICNHCRIKCQPPVTWPLSPSWPSCLQRKEAVLCCLAASPLRRSWRDPTFSGDQLSYICSFSFILNGSYHIVHGNGTKLLVHGPLELTKSCFHLNLNLTCQVLVPDVDTSDSRDIAFLGWRGALNGEHLSGDSRQLLRKDGRMLLRSQISVATIHSQGTYTCWLHKGGHLLAQKSIQVVREGNPMLIYALVLIGSFLTFLVLITITESKAEAQRLTDSALVPHCLWEDESCRGGEGLDNLALLQV
ncbi:uncharacterized protein LOC108919167 [Arapaima gigas]